MRIVIVSGFVRAVREQLEREFADAFSQRAVIWNDQTRNAFIDVHQLKTDLNSMLSEGATDFLLCLAVNRRDSNASFSVDAVVRGAMARFPDCAIGVESFKSAFATEDLIKRIEEFGPSREMQFSAVLEDLLPWLTTTHNSRLIVHSRAARGVKNSRFSDVPLLYAALDLLAREYRDSKLATPDQAASKRSVLEHRLNDLGLILAPSISESRAGEEGEDYFVEFPPGQGKKFLELHLKKGVAHDERLCLRIYFFWSEAHRCAVIGSMTAHLGTRQG